MAHFYIPDVAEVVDLVGSLSKVPPLQCLLHLHVFFFHFHISFVCTFFIALVTVLYIPVAILFAVEYIHNMRPRPPCAHPKTQVSTKDRYSRSLTDLSVLDAMTRPLNFFVENETGDCGGSPDTFVIGTKPPLPPPFPLVNKGNCKIFVASVRLCWRSLLLMELGQMVLSSQAQRALRVLTAPLR